MGSDAAAHGCGSAFVQRMARVGTGWRLTCARTPTMAERPARDAGCCGFDSRRAHAVSRSQWAVGQPAARRALTSDGPGSNPGRPAPSPSSRLLSDSGKHASPPALAAGVRLPEQARCSTCGCSSAWLRALPCHGRGRPFKSGQPLACACGGIGIRVRPRPVCPRA